MAEDSLVDVSKLLVVLFVVILLSEINVCIRAYVVRAAG